MDPSIREIYGDRVRLRACGICTDRDNVLLVRHRMDSGDFWAPPGGGVEFAEHSEAALVREFLEETGLEVKVTEFLFVCELVRPPLHAVELFFKVEVVGGVLRSGTDPESGQRQIIEEVKFMSFGDIGKLPPDAVHGIFKNRSNITEIGRLKGHFNI